MQHMEIMLFMLNETCTLQSSVLVRDDVDVFVQSINITIILRMDESQVCYGDKVELNDDQTGIIKFIGSISAGDPSHGKNKNGIYYGVHLSTKTGSHNGTVKGRKYFQCPPKYGIFVRLKDISQIIKKSKDKSTRYHMNQTIYIKNKRCIKSY